jgi:YjbE family integral membrane protein
VGGDVVVENMSNLDAWIALLKIGGINVLLSGDNAFVIALACRNLSPRDQKTAFLIGAGGIVVLMTALTTMAAYLLSLPYFRLVGSMLLLWIGVKLLVAEDEGCDVKTGGNFWEAVKIIIVADIVMSPDNVLGMAAAAKGHLGMLFVGLLITIPLVIFGAATIMRLMKQFPMVIILGAALLGFVAGDMAASDPVVKPFFDQYYYWGLAIQILGALFVVIVGSAIEHKHKANREAAPVFLKDR